MAIDYDRLMAREFPVETHSYTARDVMLYALTLGLGADPLDERQLRFVYEAELQALPTMAAILAYPGLWIREPDTGLDWEHALHSEQGVQFLKPLPVQGAVRAQTRVTGIVDKGPGRGALIYTEREGVDVATGEALFRVTHTQPSPARTAASAAPMAPSGSRTRSRTARRTKRSRSRPCRSRRCCTA